MKSVRLFIGVFIMSLIFPLLGSELKEDEDVIIYPSYIYLDSSLKEYSLKLHIQVFKRKDDSQKRKFFIESLKGQLAISNKDNEKIFEERIRAFLVDNKQYKKVSVTILEDIYQLNLTEANGHSITNLKIPSYKISNQVLADRKIEFKINSSKKNNKTYKGIIYIIPENSTCLISDIDDTIKVSDVRNKKKLIQNSFINPFNAVPGMQDFYSKLNESKINCFLFVSASPWQMYSVLNDFFSKEKFPPALYFMKYFRLKDSDFFNLFEKPEIYKTNTIEPIIQEWKSVKFILVGDSGEKDPEAYAGLAVKYPERITKIYIRKAYEENLDSRIQSVFKNVTEDKYQIFQNPDEIK